MRTNKIEIGTDIAYEKGWPTERVVVKVSGKWLYRKDGGIRKFKTKAAALKAGQDSLMTEN